MSAPQGVNLTGTVVPTDDADTYAVIDPKWGIDNWRCVADAAARNAIPDARRRVGMPVYIQTDPLGTVYFLNTATNTGTDADWTQKVIGSGGGSPGGSSGTLQFNDSGSFGGMFSSVVDSSSSSLAVGDNSTATNNNAMAFGNSCSSSGDSSFAQGKSTTASGDFSHAEGNGTTASGERSHAEGDGCTATNYAAHAEGSLSHATGQYSHAENGGTASGDNSHAEGTGTATGGYSHAGGQNSIADLQSKIAYSDGAFTAWTGNKGDGQFSILPCSTTTDHSVTTRNLTIVGGGGSGSLLLVRANFTYAFTVEIAARQRDGSAMAYFTRRGMIHNEAGTTSLSGSIQTIGTDINTPGWSIAITADDTNDALQVAVTGDPGAGVGARIFWQARLDCIEIGS